MAIKKLNHKIICLFKVKKSGFSSYQLNLLTFMKIHNVLHPNLPQKAAKNLLPDQHNDFVPLMIVDKKWEINNILDVKKVEKSKKV